MSALFVRFALLATVAVMYAVVAMPSPAPSGSSHAPVTSSTPDHASFSALHSALLGSALLPFPLSFPKEVPTESTDLLWLTEWLRERYATTGLLVQIAKRIDGEGVGRGVPGNGTSEQGKKKKKKKKKKSFI